MLTPPSFSPSTDYSSYTCWDVISKLKSRSRHLQPSTEWRKWRLKESKIFWSVKPSRAPEFLDGPHLRSHDYPSALQGLDSVEWIEKLDLTGRIVNLTKSKHAEFHDCVPAHHKVPIFCVFPCLPFAPAVKLLQISSMDTNWERVCWCEISQNLGFRKLFVFSFDSFDSRFRFQVLQRHRTSLCQQHLSFVPIPKSWGSKHRQSDVMERKEA